ncbi:MAG TPA: thiamine-phosphate kinase [Myxococcota bacterium]|nr:thiamine-phosphate kinase [Myxococcota bacterium]
MIQQIQAAMADWKLPLGIGDDAATPPPGEGQLLISSDTMVEGVHWDERLSPGDVGWKLVAVNASDLGAMGARPGWAMLNLSLPDPLDRTWFLDFLEGLTAAVRHFRLPIIGGDTTRSRQRVLSLTVGGYSRRPLLRSGGRPGDRLWVSGVLGRAAEAFYSENPSESAKAWFKRPDPPTSLGVAIAEAGLGHALMDLSDGLKQDLGRLCAASGCGARVDPSKIPGVERLDWRVAFGEDYELLLAAPGEEGPRLAALAEGLGFRLTEIGELRAEGEVILEGGWPKALFSHFEGQS